MIAGPRKEIQRIVDEYCRANPSGIRVLDVGCGCGSRIRFPETARLIGIDIDADQLANNERVHEKILGDIQTYTTDDRYDITFCWDLLEHLEHPEEALARLLEWALPGGLIVISGPNPYSLKGLITKYTPHVFQGGCTGTYTSTITSLSRPTWSHAFRRDAFSASSRDSGSSTRVLKTISSGDRSST